MNFLTQLLNLPTLTLSFLIAILAITLLFHARYNEKTVEFGPTILTTTGIFATFVGIAIGLYDFNVANIQASVPSLLSGLKTAFWGSVAGVGGALTLKYRHFIFGVKHLDETVADAAGATIEDIVRELSAIRFALAGSEDTSLVSQLKLLRADTNDRLDALKKAQSEALAMLSQMGTQAIIEALRDVIKDFNAKINEQFGENFKHLNESVEKLVIWQEQHKQQVESMTQQLDELVNIANLATQDHKKVVDQTSTFSKTAADLATLLQSLEMQKEQIRTYTESLGVILANASDAIPKIENQIVQIASQLTSSFEKNTEILDMAIKNNAMQMQKSIEEAAQASTKLVEENSAALQRVMQNASQTSAKAHEEHMKQLAQMVAKSKEQIDILDAALAEELEKALEAFGRQLTALSEKFAEDYEPLTEKLRQIVSIAGRN